MFELHFLQYIFSPQNSSDKYVGLKKFMSKISIVKDLRNLKSNQMKGDLALGGEHTIQCIDDVLQNVHLKST